VISLLEIIEITNRDFNQLL